MLAVHRMPGVGRAEPSGSDGGILSMGMGLPSVPLAGRSGMMQWTDLRARRGALVDPL
jgi:hypothetical protein